MLAAIAASAVVAVVIGVATVLIPNPLFGRDIPPVWWNYPVWLVTSVLSGMLVATYIRPYRAAADEQQANAVSEDGAATDAADEAQARRSSRMGMAGGIPAWFAVGCPVCNKLALLALGYSGAITLVHPRAAVPRARRADPDRRRTGVATTRAGRLPGPPRAGGGCAMKAADGRSGDLLRPGALEAQVMDVLWDHGPATVREVIEHLPSDPAYTTIATVLTNPGSQAPGDHHEAEPVHPVRRQDHRARARRGADGAGAGG
ncbi:BlaI/MecI/CopY family transcriptional regulator [Janibacter limosus]|uniref:BlaI/MecI/CopY family transcriptional regulator n=1 Tax=Janibacter limosus TaxID=53458 RepID=A0AC61U143_9MICO|nr:BlaI/MecI/CopY family transcriptional regulator [Janibacter limosus]UUZ43527.1 BlaI/MecI/CopY family transcriptional regulator [Janibacter limosus]